MGSILVHIVLQGLIALVPSSPTALSQGSNHMYALMVDAREKGTMDCMEKHTPRLVFRPVSGCSAAAVDLGCELGGDGSCHCLPVHLEISIEPAVEPKNDKPLPLRPDRPLPFDTNGDTGATAFSYVANLSNLGYTLRPDALQGTPPTILLSRMRFPFDSVTACALSSRRDDGADHVHALNFRRLGDEEQPGELSQAMAQKVIATVAINPATANPPAVTLKLTSFDGQHQHVFQLQPEGDGEIWIQLANERLDGASLPPGAMCEDGIGRDYGMLYDLTAEQPAWAERRIPHVKYTLWKSAADLRPEVCFRHTFKSPSNRPICPMGAFNPLPGH